MARIVPDCGYVFPLPKGGSYSRESKPKRQAPKERGRKRDEAHLALVRQLPCISTGSMDHVEAAHLRFSEDAFGKVGPGQAKPSDEWVLPLTHEEHMRQHDMGEREFWAELGIEPLKIAQQIYGISSALRASREPEEEIVRHMANIIMKARS